MCELSIEKNEFYQDAQKIEVTRGVKALVRNRPAIVTASAWGPVNDQINNSINARLITNMENDVEAKGTTTASAEIQLIIDRLPWGEWE